MITPSTPVTGGAATGFTSPTFTFVTDVAPTSNGKQYAITAVGGTGLTGVETHSVSKPFTVSIFRPANLKSLPQTNPTTGVIRNIPVNSYKVITRKGAVPAANQMPQIAKMVSQIDIPAGTDTHEPDDIRAMISAHIGFLNQLAAGLGDTCVTGIL